MLSIYRGLSKEIYIISFSRFINALGNFVFPLFTFYLTEKLHMEKEMVGLMVTLAITAYVPGMMISSFISDFWGRKKVYLFFHGMAGLIMILCGFLNQYEWAPYLVILSAVFNGGARPALSSMVADLAKSEERKAAFSLEYLCNNLGFSIGPLIGTHLYYWGFVDLIFFLNGFFIFTAVISIALFTRETLKTKEEMEEIQEDSLEKYEDGGFFEVLFKRPNLIFFSLTMILLNFCYAQTSFTLNIQMQTIFQVESSRLYGILMAINGATVVLFTPTITKIGLRVHPLNNIALAGIFYAIGMGAFSIINGFPLYILATVIWTIGEILMVVDMDNYISQNTPINFRSRFLGSIQVFSGLGYGIGPYVSGKLLNLGITTSQLWISIFFIGITAAGILKILTLREKSKCK